MHGGYGYMGEGIFSYGGMLHGPIGWLVMLVFIVFVLFLGMKLLQSLTPGKSENSESALSILKVRYAKGEINSDEFQRMKSEIN